ncbi:hypothetical protein F5I97DRAFT_133062 [Phlebopus sp. FC_14]|nr:hypothetical protein F5I97DRAFT_133062 [Phlebopus sp. FC_14]
MNDTKTSTDRTPSVTSQPTSPPVSSPSLSALSSPPTSPISSGTTATHPRFTRSQRQTRHASSGVGLRLGTSSPTSPSRVSASAKPKRRQSSIAYFTPSSPSPWEKEGQLSRLDISRVGSGSAGGCTFTESVHAPQESEKDGKGVGSAVNFSLSTRSKDLSVGASSKVSDREPLTLVERHADLLHFIAQKERKCLELRDQLAVHEKELADLKRKWERIVNRGFSHSEQFDPISSSSANYSNNAGLGSTALEGLKEGVRIIATGLSDFGVGQDITQGQQERRTSSHRALSHSQHSSDSLTSLSNGNGSGQISNSSGSSIREDDYATGEMKVDIVDEANTAIISSSSPTGSFNAKMHKRSSRPRSRDSPATYVSPVMHLSRSTSVELEGTSSSGVDASSSAKHGPSTSSALPPPSVMPGLGSLTMGVPNVGAPVTSWVGSVGKKLGELQKRETFTVNQKRASVLLADVSQSIVSVLSTGPLAATPTPSAPSSRSQPTLATNRSERRPLSSKTNRNEAGGNWLDEDEETIHAGEIMVPDSKSPSTRTIASKTEEMKALSSFNDDDWNW